MSFRRKLKQHDPEIDTALCTHAVQLHGLCALCGKNLNETSEISRASISMDHGSSALKVSEEEARRLELDTKNRLLASQKLSLIVDLDQTIIHASVDAADAALSGISTFKIEDIPYYLKTRPLLDTFLAQLAQLYEMHVYTMGTRDYAEAVCRVIDPQGAYFNSRILTRDESGNLTQKKIDRLFPTDSSMVVIIDDREDVWGHSPNLLRVAPYTFFRGTGDINSGDIGERPNAEKKRSAGPPSDDDTELDRVLVLLKEIHRGYYGRVSPANSPAHSRAHSPANAGSLRDSPHASTTSPRDPPRGTPTPPLWDVRDVIARIKRRTFRNVNLRLAGLDDARARYWYSVARNYGAESSRDRAATHVVCAKGPSAALFRELRGGMQKGRGHLLTWSWFLDSLSSWHKQDESEYAVQVDFEDDDPTPEHGPEGNGGLGSVDLREPDGEVRAPDESYAAGQSGETGGLEGPQNASEARVPTQEDSDGSGEDDDSSDEGGDDEIAHAPIMDHDDWMQAMREVDEALEDTESDSDSEPAALPPAKRKRALEPSKLRQSFSADDDELPAKRPRGADGEGTISGGEATKTGARESLAGSDSDSDDLSDDLLDMANELENEMRNNQM